MGKDFRWRVQSESAECGLACIVICLNVFGSKISLRQARAFTPAPAGGMTLRQISDMASAHGLLTRAVRCDMDSLTKLALPAIIHWKFNHFIVLTKKNPDGRWAAVDPAIGSVSLKELDISKSFTGIALEVFETPSFVKKPEPPRSSIRSYLSFNGELATALLQAVTLSILVQIFILASPFFLQLSIDEAALKSDRGLLSVLAVGFLALSLFNSIADLLRGMVVQRISSIVAWQVTTRLFHHMLRLPVWWFQRRRLADTLVRFDSIAPIRQLISDGIVSTVLDGLLSLTLLAVMFFYSWKLALLVLLTSTLCLAAKLSSVPVLLRLSQNVLQAVVSEKGKRIETLKAIQAIKLMNGESMRERDWANSFGQSVSESERVARFQVCVSSLQSAIEGVGFVAIIYFAAVDVIDATMTVGMLYAFLAYRSQFSARVIALIDQIVQWHLMSLHVWRLSDIADEQKEPGLDIARVSKEEIVDGSVHIQDLSFSYSSFDEPVLKGINAKINNGECAVIFGASGGGKSTFLKVITGLYPASSGQIIIDGMKIEALGPSLLRRSIGTVMQDDDLMSGTIVDNVTFFDEEPNIQKVWGCLELASVADEVRGLPMNINTLIGDMGSRLSGGQKQRIVLARALYRSPKILILDEATSSLDTDNEIKIHEALKEMRITRIVVTHRPDTARIADKLFVLEAGLLQQLPLDHPLGR